VDPRQLGLQRPLAPGLLLAEFHGRTNRVQVAAVISFLIGPLSFEYLPDGDDPGTGLLRIRLDGQQVEVECSRDQYDWFWKEAGP